MALQVPSTVSFITVDSSTPKTIQLPLASERLGRVLTIKDRTGQANTNNITIQVQGSDTFQDGSTTYRITVSFGSATFVSRSGQWVLSQGTQDIKASTLTVSNLLSTVALNASTVRATFFIGDGSLLSNLPAINQGLVSTPNLLGLVSTSFLDSRLASTTTGLGSLGYLSSLTGFRVSTGTITASTVTLLDPFLGAQNFLTVSSGVLLLNGAQISGGSGGAGVSQIIAGTNISVSPVGGTGVVTINNTGPTAADLVSTSVGLGTFGYVSTATLVSTTAGLERYVSSFIDPTELASSVLQFISSTYFGTQLTSTVVGLGTTGYVSSASLRGLVSTNNLVGLVSTLFLDRSLVSTTTGLGTLGYVSSLRDFVSTPNLVNLVSTVFLDRSLVSTTTGLGALGYVSSVRDFVSSPNLVNLVSTVFLDRSLVSTTTGLGTLGYISSVRDVVSTPNLVNLVSTVFLDRSLVSTTTGLATLGYISSLRDVVSTPNLVNHVSTVFLDRSLVSTTTGLGTLGYASSLRDLVSTPNLVNLVSTVFLDRSLVSTTTGLGTLGYVSSVSNFVSTPNLVNLVSTIFLDRSLVSTTTGLGTLGFISSASLTSSILSTVTSVGRFLSSMSTSYAQSFNTQTANISATTTSSILIGLGDGFLAMPDIRPTSMSTLITLTSSFRAFNVQIGAVSTINAIQFYGLFGNFNNTAIAEISTGAGTQELLFFKGSSVSDQIRFQTTGSFEVETGVSARLWPNAPPNATPSFIIDTASNVGIQTATPQTTLDVAGTGRFQTLSTLRLNISSISGVSVVQTSNLVSTVAGLGTSLYVSTLTLNSSIAGSLSSFSTALGPVGSGTLTAANLTSTTTGLGTLGYISSLRDVVSTPNLVNLVSTVFLDRSLVSTTTGLGTLGYLSTLRDVVSTPNLVNLVSTVFLDRSLVSTTTGLGTLGYLSAVRDLVSTPNLVNLVSTVFLDRSLVSTTTGLGTLGYLSTLRDLVSTPNLVNLVSTVFLDRSLVSTTTGLGTLGYLSTLRDLVSTPNLVNLVSTSFFDRQVTSTVVGLGSASYISSLTLVSTTAGLERYISSFIDPQELASSIRPFISTPNLLNLVSTVFLDRSLVSTTTGLGTLGYLSSLTGFRVSTGTITASTVTLLDPYLGAPNFLTVSSGVLLLNGAEISGGAGGAGVSQIVAGSNISISPLGGTGIVTINNTGPSSSDLISSVAGLGTSGYVSTAALLNLVSTPNLLTLVSTPNLLQFVSTLSNVLYISAQQMYASSIFATTAGPVTMVLYEM